MSHTYTLLNFHVIWTTAGRHPAFKIDDLPRIWNYLGGVARQNGFFISRAGGMPDHVHVLMRLPAHLALAEAVRSLKSNSSRWINEERLTEGRFTWQSGYAAFTVSHSNLDSVERYIDDQAEHHRYRTFADEFSALMTRLKSANTGDQDPLWQPG